MKWITEEKNSKGETVQFHVKVNIERKGLKIPSETKTVKSGDGKTTYFVLPGRCLVADETDAQFSQGFTDQCKVFGDKVTPYTLLNSALDLASRKLIEDEYREEGGKGSALKNLVTATDWYTSLPIEEMISLKAGFPPKTGNDEVDKAATREHMLKLYADAHPSA